MSSSISFPTYQSIAIKHSSESAIRKESSSFLKFHYSTVSYEEFSKAHSSQGAISRIVTAIPRALVAGVVKTIYHIALSIFSLPDLLLGDAQPVQIQLYSLVRSLQESLGWITTLFHDELGSFLVEESLFQKNCYATFESSKFPYSGFHGHYSFNGITMPFYEQAVKINLLQFKEMNEADRQNAIEKFDLTEEIEELQGEQFFQKLESSNPEALKLASLADLKQPLATSKVKYTILPDAEFCKLTVNHLQSLSREQIQVLLKRVELIQKSIHLKTPTCQNLLETPLVQFHLVPSRKINESIDKLPRQAFLFLQSNQILELDFTKIPQEALHSLFPYVDGKKEKDSFAKLSPLQVQGVISRLNEHQLSLISDAQLKGLDLKDLSREKLQALFLYVDGKEEKRRFALLSSKQAQGALPHLGDYQLSLISDTQLKDLDLKDLSREKLQSLFRYVDGKEEKKRFALLSPKQVQEALPRLGDYQFSLISDTQLKDLDLKDLSREQLQALFRYVDGKTEKRRFAYIQDINSVIEKLGKLQMDLLSSSQIKQLKFEKLSQDQLSYFFPKWISKEDLLKSHTQVSYTYISSDRAEKKIRVTISENEAEKASNELKQKLLQNWALLSSFQKRQVHNRLFPENQALLSV